MKLVATAVFLLIATGVECRRIIPQTYDARVELPAQGQGQSCPAPSTTQMTNNDIVDNIQNVIRDSIVPALQCALGECEANPATSCNHVLTSNPLSQTGWYWLKGCGGPNVRAYCVMGNPCGCNGGDGAWRRMIFFNMSDTTQECPAGAELITTPVRSCKGVLGNRRGCGQAFFASNYLPYSRVCGRVIGYQFGSPDAFRPFFDNRDFTIDDPYFDGVSITYGFSPRKHVWTFIGAPDETARSPWHCSCSNVNAGDWQGAMPSFISNDYFCDSGTTERWQNRFYDDDPLWDGQGCGPDSTCCTLNNPPWFCKDLPDITTDDMEARFCADEPNSSENTPINLIEVYVQ